jgi:hypothetical protein
MPSVVQDNAQRTILEPNSRQNPGTDGKLDLVAAHLAEALGIDAWARRRAVGEQGARSDDYLARWVQLEPNSVIPVNPRYPAPSKRQDPAIGEFSCLGCHNAQSPGSSGK